MKKFLLAAFLALTYLAGANAQQNIPPATRYELAENHYRMQTFYAPPVAKTTADNWADFLTGANQFGEARRESTKVTFLVLGMILIPIGILLAWFYWHPKIQQPFKSSSTTRTPVKLHAIPHHGAATA